MVSLGKIDFTKGLKTCDTYEVTRPWRLGFKPDQHVLVGKTPLSGDVILFSDFNPNRPNDDLDEDEITPKLIMEYDRPFWELSDRNWDLFKLRVIAFSKKNARAEHLCPVKESDLEDLKDRLSGRWIDK